jgi:hypothetical protein
LPFCYSSRVTRHVPAPGCFGLIGGATDGASRALPPLPTRGQGGRPLPGISLKQSLGRVALGPNGGLGASQTEKKSHVLLVSKPHGKKGVMLKMAFIRALN